MFLKAYIDSDIIQYIVIFTKLQVTRNLDSIGSNHKIHNKRIKVS